MDKQTRIKSKMVEVTNLGLTDKTSYHSYDQIYPILLYPFLDKKLNILEIGTGKGGGLKILSELFTESTIYGLDHNYSILEIETEGTNIKLLSQSDQSNINLDELPNIDIVIEDASHDYRKSIETFNLILPKLNKGAIYIIEDVYPQYKELYMNDKRFEVYDLSHVKDRGDDIVAVFENI